MELDISINSQSSLSARERILVSAHDLFYKNGIRATGVDLLIAQAKVTKTTFYRHFPSKNDLIIAFLKYRHERWRNWFVDCLERHGDNLDAICPCLAEWFDSDNFRGCAFINSVVEMSSVIPEVAEISRDHKQDIGDIITALLPKSPHQKEDAVAIVLAIDGAIIRAQFDQSSQPSLALLQRILDMLAKG